jgi:hypothetical protein
MEEGSPALRRVVNARSCARWPALSSLSQVVLSSSGETATTAHVYRPDWYSGGGSSAGGDAVESLLLQDWVVGSQVGHLAWCGSIWPLPPLNLVSQRLTSLR